MDCGGPGATAADFEYSDSMGRAVRAALRRAILDGRRSDQIRHPRRVANFSRRRDYEWPRRFGYPAAELDSLAGAFLAHFDDGIVEHLRFAWSERSAELRRLCNLRAVHRDNHGGWKISRCGAAHRGSGADHDLLLFGRSVARAFRFALDETGAGGIRFIFYQRRDARTAGHDSGGAALRHSGQRGRGDGLPAETRLSRFVCGDGRRTGRAIYAAGRL